MEPQSYSHMELNSANSLNELGSGFTLRASRKKPKPAYTATVSCLKPGAEKNPSQPLAYKWGGNQSVLFLALKFVVIHYNSNKKLMHFLLYFILFNSSNLRGHQNHLRSFSKCTWAPSQFLFIAL